MKVVAELLGLINWLLILISTHLIMYQIIAGLAALSHNHNPNNPTSHQSTYVQYLLFKSIISLSFVFANNLSFPINKLYGVGATTAVTAAVATLTDGLADDVVAPFATSASNGDAGDTPAPNVPAPSMHGEADYSGS